MTKNSVHIELQLEQIKQGAHQIVPEQELLKKLQRSKPLVVKLGMDPTAPDLHLGHAVVLSKLRQLQELGHRIIFLIGDFTARIGDPTGKSKTRPALSENQIVHNTKTYFDQVSRILNPDAIEIKYNSAWLEHLSMQTLIELCAKVTVARLVERDDFAQRIERHQTISFHELLYPLMQGYDSVELKADIELGGSDQTFNLLMGRFLQEQYGQEPQVVLTMPLLLGLDGVHKMSKSLGNAIGLAEPAQEAYGKLMSIADDLMWHYATVLLQSRAEYIAAMKEAVVLSNFHPMDAKKEIAQLIVERFWSKEQAQQAARIFESVVQNKEYDLVPERALRDCLANPLWIVELLKELEFVASSSEAKRLIEAKAVAVDGIVVADFKAQILYKKGTVIVVGKHRACRIKI